MRITFIPHGQSHNEHNYGENSADDSATNVSGFAVSFFDWELVRSENFLVKHFKYL